jgi:hypothetical protein
MKTRRQLRGTRREEKTMPDLKQLELRFDQGKSGPWSVQVRRCAGAELVDLEVDKRRPNPQRGFALLCVRSKLEAVRTGRFPKVPAAQGTLLYSFCGIAKKDALPGWLAAIFSLRTDPEPPWNCIAKGRDRFQIELTRLDGIRIVRKGEELEEEQELSELLEDLERAWPDPLSADGPARLVEDIPTFLAELASLSEEDGTSLTPAVLAGIRKSSELSLEVAANYRRLVHDPSYLIREPLHFDSHQLSTTVYIHSLRNAKRFCTTTFLSSGFWIGNDVEIFSANGEMLARLADATGRVPAGVVRRAFVLPRSFDEEVKYRTEQMHFQGQCNGFQEAQRCRAPLERIKREMDALALRGCEIRATYDPIGLHAQLPAELHFDPLDSELAIWDDAELHVYSGGRSGRITELDVYNSRVLNADFYLQKAREYFEALWSLGRPAEQFFGELIESQIEAEYRFEYDRLLWKWLHDDGLSLQDRELKWLEEKRAKEELHRLGRFGTIRHHLDVGTFAGRYLSNLREAVVPGGAILGIDVNPTCVEFARWQLSQRQPTSHQVNVQPYDFLSSAAPPFHMQFDFLTCMMGTVAHFGCRRHPSAEKDSLRIALRKVHDLLSDDGIAFVSRWTDSACRSRSLLDMYQNYDRERLALWNPNLEEFRKAAEQTGLWMARPRALDGRLELLILSKNREIQAA